MLSKEMCENMIKINKLSSSICTR